MKSVDYQSIELLAYYIYLTEGRPEGRASQHWNEAEYLIATDTLMESSAARHNGHGEDMDRGAMKSISSNFILKHIRADDPGC